LRPFLFAGLGASVPYACGSRAVFSSVFCAFDFHGTAMVLILINAITAKSPANASSVQCLAYVLSPCLHLLISWHFFPS
jgi:hypothetical protein